MIVDMIRTESNFSEKKIKTFDYEGCSCHIAPPCSYCTSHCNCGICDNVVHNDHIIEMSDSLVCEDCLVIRLSQEFKNQYPNLKNQYPNLSVRGFYNPIIVNEDETTIEFRCAYAHYPYDVVPDTWWTWNYDKKTHEFFSW